MVMNNISKCFDIDIGHRIRSSVFVNCGTISFFENWSKAACFQRGGKSHSGKLR
jgi:hypothetical protein